MRYTHHTPILTCVSMVFGAVLTMCFLSILTCKNGCLHHLATREWANGKLRGGCNDRYQAMPGCQMKIFRYTARGRRLIKEILGWLWLSRWYTAGRRHIPGHQNAPQSTGVDAAAGCNSMREQRNMYGVKTRYIMPPMMRFCSNDR